MSHSRAFQFLRKDHAECAKSERPPTHAIIPVPRHAAPQPTRYSSFPKALISIAAIPHRRPPMGHGSQKNAITPDE